MMHNGLGQYGNWLCGPGAFLPGPFGWILMLLFWGVIIAIVVKVFGVLFSRNKNRSLAALEVLKERYASGDIGAEEYKRVKEELS